MHVSLVAMGLSVSRVIMRASASAAARLVFCTGAPRLALHGTLHACMLIDLCTSFCIVLSALSDEEVLGWVLSERFGACMNIVWYLSSLM